jgi:predicted TIM-barrel fold metal-dependent hydrolase
MAELTKSAQAHARLSHPVIDSDGHWIEYLPALTEYLKKVIGQDGADRYWAAVGSYFGDPKLTTAQRREKRLPVMGWWAVPTRNTLDRATVMLPKLLAERMGDLGLDFAVLYPTAPTLTIGPYLEDEEIRRGGCRALNMYASDLFRDYPDRFAAVGVIPNHTPKEAIEELEFAKSVGIKAVVFAGLVSRPSPGGNGARYWDTLTLDSDYDYDPVWAKCQELKIVPTFHTSTLNFGYRTQRTSFVYNHVGHFAAGCEAMCKALFLGGVTLRFPKLKFAFMEGGAAWACNLYNDLVRHWNIRNPKALENFDPANLDREYLVSLVSQHGNQLMKDLMKNQGWQRNSETAGVAPQLEDMDDFWRCKISKGEDLRDLFASNLYFGCESEDPLNAMAFNTRANAFGARLNILLGSDIGHFDVLEMTEVIEEAWELVEHGVLTEQQLKDFTLTNPARFWTHLDRDFFKGTAVEKEVNQVLAGD